MRMGGCTCVLLWLMLRGISCWRTIGDGIWGLHGKVLCGVRVYGTMI